MKIITGKTLVFPEFEDWFNKRFQSGEAKYQDVLDALVEEDKIIWSKRLVNFVGPDHDTVMQLESFNRRHLFVAGDLIVEKGIRAEGEVWVGGKIRVGREIWAGCGIFADRGIEAGYVIGAGYGIWAGEGIKAGYGILAGKGIEAGYGIEAGEGIKAGYGIEAGHEILAGYGIEAGEGIKAGGKIICQDGIWAGMNVPKDEWPTRAKIIAKTKPSNILSGHWVKWMDKG